MSPVDDPRTVADAGEYELVARIAARIGPPPAGQVWAGDDGAVVSWPSPTLVYTIDALTEGVDFDFAYCSGGDAGFKAVAANVSDVAAMGARPLHAVCALTLPPSTSMRIVEGILDGMLEAASLWGLAVVGGDVGRASEVSLALAVTGEPLPGGPVLRSGARPGHVLCVTGTLGAAAAGLRALRRGSRGGGARRLARRQLRPLARTHEAALLCRHGVSAMIDLSDGLAVDLPRLCSASGVGALVDDAALPVDADVAELEGDDALALAIGGGEDYELLCALPADAAPSARTALEDAGCRLTEIGIVVEGGVTIGGRPVAEWRATAWEHLRDP